MYIVKSFLFVILASVGTLLGRELNKAFHGYMTSDLYPMPNGQRMAIAIAIYRQLGLWETPGNLI